MRVRRAVQLSQNHPSLLKEAGLDPVCFYEHYDMKPNFRDGDVLVLWGGEDISPELYNEQSVAGSPRKPTTRDLFELKWATAAFEQGVPMLGICRGSQFLSMFAGGRLFQDVVGHTSNHEITTNEGEIMMVTSTHHQMMRPQGTAHVLLAWANGISPIHRTDPTAPRVEIAEIKQEPEAVYFADIGALAIQFHPEYLEEGAPCRNYAQSLIKRYVLEKK